MDYDWQSDGHRFCVRAEPNPNDAETWVFFHGAGQDAIGEFYYSIPQIHSPLTCQTNMTISHETLFRLVLGAESDEKKKNIILVDLTWISHPKSEGAQGY